ncbi:N-acetyltransferase [Actinoplanes sp. NBRC 14428]|uniref:RimJ/RimL family protein N-acetyltransferase n=1 Tax=Pseudosporangium ferrugineum TaxID=439699 RepID=A0A2T0S8V0_9ACTN|nr:RimJ/RimL family protein N-acetyltransferase [Pseudosporangium ferrugineum]BCJ50825.1 N-acetyltransferase [Actinoplanes sp. NBRC 14428]
MIISELKTARLLLRQWRADDVMPWAAMNADPLVREHFPEILTYDQSAGSVDAFRSELERRGWGWWALELAATGEFIGMAGLDPVDDELPFGGVEVGWRLARSAWGHGYATEAGHACLDYGFDVLNLTEILAITAVGNQRSQAVMHRLGMTRDPADDFDDPTVPPGPLRRSVVYRIKR